jgi:hypothetical protein
MNRQATIMELRKVRAQLDGVITNLSRTHGEHSVREQRPENMPLESAEVVAERWGVDLDDEPTEMPDWVIAKFGHLINQEPTQ